MSAFKTILVPVSDAKTGAASLNAAFAVATSFASHVVALHVRTDPTNAVPLVGEGMSGSMVEEMMDIAERQAATRAEAAHALFEDIRGRLGVALASAPPTSGPTAEWIDLTGREEEAVAWRGRLSDLVVLSRPAGTEEVSAMMTLNAALMESGKPLLLTPPQPAGTVGRNIAIAWNGSAEAGRAVGWAMPMLAAADKVTVLSVSEDDRTVGAPAGELAAYLAWHGIKAEATLLHASASHAGEELLAQATAAGADMLVMGAYTHSRLRQLILGGVTRHVLHHAAMACLMCH
jgi:nucleotide-binding universal stress UspA family protein